MAPTLTPTQLAALTQGDWLKHRTDDLWFQIVAISEPRDIGGSRTVRDITASLLSPKGIRHNYSISETLMASPTGGTVKAERVRFAADLRVAA